MLADRREFLCCSMHDDPLQRLLPRRAEQKRQSDNMVEVGVRQQNVERVGGEVLTNSEKSGPRVEYDSLRRQHQAGRMSPLVRVIAARAEQEQFHGRASRW